MVYVSDGVAGELEYKRRYMSSQKGGDWEQKKGGLSPGHTVKYW